MVNYKLILTLFNAILLTWSQTAADSPRQFNFDIQDANGTPYRPTYASNIYGVYPGLLSGGPYGNLNGIGFGLGGLGGLGYGAFGGLGYNNLRGFEIGGLGYSGLGGNLGYAGLGGIFGNPLLSGLYPNYYGNPLMNLGLGGGLQGFNNPYLYNQLYGNYLLKK